MIDSSKSINPLRQRLIDNMTLRKLGSGTQLGYIRAVKRLTRFLERSPDSATAEDLRRFQLDLVSTGVSPVTINACASSMSIREAMMVSDRCQAASRPW